MAAHRDLEKSRVWYGQPTTKVSSMAIKKKSLLSDNSTSAFTNY